MYFIKVVWTQWHIPWLMLAAWKKSMAASENTVCEPLCSSHMRHRCSIQRSLDGDVSRRSCYKPLHAESRARAKSLANIICKSANYYHDAVFWSCVSALLLFHLSSHMFSASGSPLLPRLTDWLSFDKELASFDVLLLESRELCWEHGLVLNISDYKTHHNRAPSHIKHLVVPHFVNRELCSQTAGLLLVLRSSKSYWLFCRTTSCFL